MLLSSLILRRTYLAYFKDCNDGLGARLCRAKQTLVFKQLEQVCEAFFERSIAEVAGLQTGANMY